MGPILTPELLAVLQEFADRHDDAALFINRAGAEEGYSKWVGAVSVSGAGVTYAAWEGQTIYFQSLDHLFEDDGGEWMQPLTDDELADLGLV